MTRELIDRATNLALRLSPSRAKGIAEILFNEPRELGIEELRWVGEGSVLEELVQIVGRWHEAKLPISALGGIFAGASSAGELIDAEQSIDIVWTGPKSQHVPVRRTEQALIDLISVAEREIFLVSFVVYEYKPLINALMSAQTRGVIIKALVESPKTAGGNLDTGNPVKAMQRALPDAQVYVWLNRDAEFELGSVHAKIAIADNRQVLVSSANLTGHAMSKNIEAGFLIKGGNVPGSMREHLQDLIDTKVLQLA
jgi:cardiolipin synthase